MKTIELKRKDIFGDLKKIEELQNKIDKAIEYIEHAQNYGLTKQVMPQMRLYINGNDVLDILKGDGDND